MKKIGLVVITYSRPQYFKQCLESLESNNWGGATVRGVAIDFKNEEIQKELEDIAKQYKVTVIKASQNIGVGPIKNQALKWLYQEGCTDLFIMEDDIVMKNKNTCFHYINEASQSGVEHMNFALHGPLNINQKMHKMFNGRMVTYYPHCVGAFSYYTRNVIDKVGYLDENFKNAWEHVEHTYRIGLQGLTTPFWYFADHSMSHLMLEEIPGSIDNSSIRPREDWRQNIYEGQLYWIKKHGSWLPERK